MQSCVGLNSSEGGKKKKKPPPAAQLGKRLELMVINVGCTKNYQVRQGCFGSICCQGVLWNKL